MSPATFKGLIEDLFQVTDIAHMLFRDYDSLNKIFKSLPKESGSKNRSSESASGIQKHTILELLNEKDDQIQLL